MRHIVGFLVGLILTPVVLVGSGWAFTRMAGLGGDETVFLSASALSPLGALFGLAFVVALVMVPPRLTPLLPGITGLSLAGFTALNVVRPELIERVPSVPGMEGALTLAGLGLYLPLALALIIPVFIGRRWRRRETRQEYGTDPVTPAEYFDGLYEEEEEEEKAPERVVRRGGRRRRTA